jgi:hypothetical protein
VNVTTRLFTAAKRAANLIATAPAEGLTAANGWTIGAAITTSPSSLAGPFGYGLGTLFTMAAGANRVARLAVDTFTAGANTATLFLAPGTITSFTLGLTDTTNTVVHEVTFTLSGGVWSVTGLAGGATGTAHAYPYDNGWTRFSVSFTPGAPGGGVTVAGNARRWDFFSVTASCTATVWGATVQEDATTPTDPTPYISGLAGDSQYLPVVYPQRVQDETGIFQIQMLSTPDATIDLQARSAPDAPWYTVLNLAETALVAGTYAALVGIFPQMRAYIRELNNTTTTLDAWLTE